MDISYFREFVLLAEIKNYWAAAERLYIGQSSLSKHIKTMEQQLGAPLFNRTSRKVELTEFGKKMLPFAQRIARLQYEYEAAAYNFLQTGNMILDIASIPVIPHYYITDILIEYQKDYPNMQINMQEADTLILREWLIERKCELAFYRDSLTYLDHDPLKEARLTKIPYWEDQLMAVLPKDHKLSGIQQIELSQLAEESFAFIKKDTMPYTLCMRVCQEAGFMPKVQFTSHNLETLLDMVVKGDCVSLQFFNQVEFFRKTFYAKQVVALPIYPPIKTTIYLAYLNDIPLSKAATHFLEYLDKHKLN